MASPWKTLWFHPRQTVRAVLDRDASYMLLPLIFSYGIFDALDYLCKRNAGDTMSLAQIAAIALVLGPIRGIISVFVATLVCALTGRWLGGRADRGNLQIAFAWSIPPYLVAGLLGLPAMAFFGAEYFKSEPNLGEGPEVALLVFAPLVLQVPLLIWSIVLYVQGVAELQGFSAWRALGSIVLATLIVAVPVLGLVYLLS